MRNQVLQFYFASSQILQDILDDLVPNLGIGGSPPVYLRQTVRTFLEDGRFALAVTHEVLDDIVNTGATGDDKQLHLGVTGHLRFEGERRRKKIHVALLASTNARSSVLKSISSVYSEMMSKRFTVGLSPLLMSCKGNVTGETMPMGRLSMAGCASLRQIIGSTALFKSSKVTSSADIARRQMVREVRGKSIRPMAAR